MFIFSKRLEGNFCQHQYPFEDLIEQALAKRWRSRRTINNYPCRIGMFTRGLHKMTCDSHRNTFWTSFCLLFLNSRDLSLTLPEKGKATSVYYPHMPKELLSNLLLVRRIHMCIILPWVKFVYSLVIPPACIFCM